MLAIERIDHYVESQSSVLEPSREPLMRGSGSIFLGTSMI